MILSQQIPGRLYFRIRDVAKIAGVEPHVLRFWETEFPVISPQKSPAGHRVYRRSDVESVLLVKQLLYVERLTIEGARKRLAELRKEGELKRTRESFIHDQETMVAKRERLEKLKALSQELKHLIDQPIDSIYKK